MNEIVLPLSVVGLELEPVTVVDSDVTEMATVLVTAAYAGDVHAKDEHSSIAIAVNRNTPSCLIE